MSKENKEVEKNDFIETVEVEIPQDVREAIAAKAAELKAKHKIRKVYICIVKGEEDEKPFYVAYLRKPSLPHFSQYVTFAPKDTIQANKMLAQNIFLDGDRELVDDDDLFLWGLMPQLNSILEMRSGELVKK